MTVYRPGDLVQITAGGRTVDGEVVIASPCGKSLMVQFEAILSGHVGAMPLLAEGEGFVSVVTGEPVALTGRERDA